MSHDEEKEVFPFPGKVKSSVWEFFGFYKDDFGNLDKSRAICKLCRKGTNYSGNTTNLRTHIVHHHKDVAALPDVNYSKTQLSRSVTTHNQETNFGTAFINHLAMSPDGYSQVGTPKMQRQMVLDEIMIPPLSADITGTLSKLPTQKNAWVIETTPGLTEPNIVYSKESPGLENSSGSFADSETESYGGVTTVNDAVFETVIQDLIPIETVDSPRFRKLISAGRRHLLVPSSKEITKLIVKRTADLKEMITSELAQSTHKSLKFEIWKSSDITYLTISVQALFDNWKMKCYVLKTVEMPENFALQDLEEVLSSDKLGMSFDKKVITSDENNVIEEFTEMKGCMHIVSLCKTIDRVANLCLEENIGANLIIKVQNIIKFFSDCKEAVAVLSEKQKVLQLPVSCLKDCNKKNWHSCLATFESILEQSNAVIASFNDAKLQSLCPTDKLTSSDFAIIQTLINMLVPLKTALTLTKGMKYPTTAVILPVVKKLEMSMSCKETDSQQVVDLKTKMVTMLKKCYGITEKRHFLLLCSLLDPRFKGLKFVSQKDQDVAYEHLKRETMGIKNRSKLEEDTGFDESSKCIVKIEVDDDYLYSQGTAFNMCSRNSEETDDRLSHQQKNKRQKLMEKTLSKATCSESATDDWLADVIYEVKEGQSEEDSVIVEINRYKGEMQISSSSSPLSWWRDRQKSFPLLSQVATRYISVPALLGNKDIDAEEWFFRQRSSIPAHLVDPVIFLHANYEKYRRLEDEL